MSANDSVSTTDSPDPLRPFVKRAVAKMALAARYDSAENEALEGSEVIVYVA